jgi:hypothetical protein
MLREARMKPQPVPGRILLPLIESCSLEEEPDLQRRWAALLANAASDGESSKVLPGYVEALRQLTPVQARLLEWLYSNVPNDEKHEDGPEWSDYESRDDVTGEFGLSRTDYDLLISDLARLQLVEGRRNLSYHTLRNMDQLAKLVAGRWDSRHKYDSVGLTTLGYHFIQACSPPKVR